MTWVILLGLAAVGVFALFTQMGATRISRATIQSNGSSDA